MPYVDCLMPLAAMPLVAMPLVAMPLIVTPLTAVPLMDLLFYSLSQGRSISTFRFIYQIYIPSGAFFFVIQLKHVINGPFGQNSKTFRFLDITHVYTFTISIYTIARTRIIMIIYTHCRVHRQSYLY